MKLNLRIASLLVVIGIFGFSTTVLAQKNISKKTKPGAMTSKPGSTSGNTRPPSTGTGNADTRSASTGEEKTDADLIFLTLQTLNSIGANIPSATIKENGGANVSRTEAFTDSAFNHVNNLADALERQTGKRTVGALGSVGNMSSMENVKNWLEMSLDYLNQIEFESNNQKADAKDKINQAIAQAQAYIANPPAKTRPAKKNPKGTDVANPNGTSQSDTSQQRMIKSDTSLKTPQAGIKNAGEIDPCETQSSNSGSNKTANPKGKNQPPTANGVTSTAGHWECAKANEKSTQPNNSSDTTNAKPKASSKTTKPTNNLSGEDNLEFKSQPKAKTKKVTIPNKTTPKNL